MDTIVKHECFFLGLLLRANKRQRQCLLQTITRKQLSCLVEIVYNALNGSFVYSPSDIKSLNRHKKLFRQIIAKKKSRRERVKLIARNFNSILKLLNVIKSGIKVQWRES